MKIDIWMPFFVSDYLGDTMELTTEEHGIYLLLLLQYWKKGQLTNNIKKLQIVTKTDDKNIDSLNSILSEFFTLKQDKYINNRIEIELKKANSRRESASINGKKGGRPPKKNNPQETHSFIEGKPTGNPTPNPQESSSSSSSSSPISTHKPLINVESDFNEIYSHYPVKKGKAPAFIKYKLYRKNKSVPDKSVLINSIEKFKRSDKDWMQGFIPHFSTWMNQKKWEDEVTEDKVFDGMTEEEFRIKIRADQEAIKKERLNA